MYLLWRLLYGALDSFPVIWCTVRLVRLVGAVKGDRVAELMLDWAEARTTFSGWPGHASGWTNLHASRFFRRVRRALAPRPTQPKRARRRADVLRIACAGRFRGLLGFPAQLFAACPDGVDLTIVDFGYQGESAGYLAPLASRYVAIDLDSPQAYDRGVRCAAAAVNEGAADVLLNASMKTEGYDLVDLVDTPCIMNYCTGSDLLHHEKVDVQLHGQPQADYFVEGDRIFCGTTRTWFGNSLVLTFRGLYDSRGLDHQPVRPWAEREPLLLFHGSVRKLAEQPVLDVILSLLADDSGLRFVFMGKAEAAALSGIASRAGAYGVSARVHYDGQFSSTRDSTGVVSDAGWARMASSLGRARLAPDPWPIGGGSSRFECYMSGVPAVHMGLRLDPASWGREQPAALEPLPLAVEAGTAYSVAEYGRLCKRCLYDEPFANALAQKQLTVARRAADPQRWWKQVLASYDSWVAHTTATS